MAELEHDEHEGLDEASLLEHEEITKVKNVANVLFGKYIMECWYFSPFPKVPYCYILTYYMMSAYVLLYDYHYLYCDIIVSMRVISTICNDSYYVVSTTFTLIVLFEATLHP